MIMAQRNNMIGIISSEPFVSNWWTIKIRIYPASKCALIINRRLSWDTVDADIVIVIIFYMCKPLQCWLLTHSKNAYKYYEMYFPVCTIQQMCLRRSRQRVLRFFVKENQRWLHQRAVPGSWSWISLVWSGPAGPREGNRRSRRWKCRGKEEKLTKVL